MSPKRSVDPIFTLVMVIIFTMAFIFITYESIDFIMGFQQNEAHGVMINDQCGLRKSKYDDPIKTAVETHWIGTYKDEWCWYKKQLIAESNLRPNICSAKGACGIAQFMPHIAKAYRIDPMNPLESIDAGANLMSDLISRFHRDDRMCTLRMSWASYQWGYGNVKRAIQRSGTPCWHNGIKYHVIC